MASKTNSNEKMTGTQQTDFDFGFLNSGVLLYHRREANRQLQVAVMIGFETFNFRFKSLTTRMSRNQRF